MKIQSNHEFTQTKESAKKRRSRVIKKTQADENEEYQPSNLSSQVQRKMISPEKLKIRKNVLKTSKSLQPNFRINKKEDKTKILKTFKFQ